MGRYLWVLAGVWVFVVLGFGVGLAEVRGDQGPGAGGPGIDRLNVDRVYALTCMRDYSKAPDRTWTHPVQMSGMIRHSADVLKWCDRCEARWGFKDKTFADGTDQEGRLKNEVRQVRSYVAQYALLKGEIAKSLEGKAGALIKAADAETEKGAATGQADDFNKGRVSLGKAQDLCVLARAVYEPSDGALVKLEEELKALEGRVGERQKVYWEKSREKAMPVAQGYTGADLARVQAVVLEAWKEAYPQETGVEVIVPGNTHSRVTLVVFNPVEETIDLKDVSLLPVRVRVDAAGGNAWVYSAVVVKSGPTVSPVLTVDVKEREGLRVARDLVKR